MTATLYNGLLLVAALAVLALLLSPRVLASPYWRAMVTPLASIIGSGFLVSIPLLSGALGNWAFWGMLALIVFAYLVGGAIRFNILHGEPLFADARRTGRVATLTRQAEYVSHMALACAYVVSVAYYLSLLSIFLLQGLGIDNPLWARGLTTAFLVSIGVIGALRGLQGLERLEEYAVAFKLAVIAAILLALVTHNSQLAIAGHWQLATLPERFDWQTVRVLFGLVIVVQGFETSRFMGGSYPAPLRAQTMRSAQLVSGAIYLLFFASATVLFQAHYADGEVAAIVGLVGELAMVLPALLIGAAVASQFSAAVADAIGGAGILQGNLAGRFQENFFYPAIALLSIGLVWSGSVLDIIAWASRAFAVYYGLQCGVAMLVAQETPSLARRRVNVVGYGLLALTATAVALLGIPAAA
jgi:hypothetical protein